MTALIALLGAGIAVGIMLVVTGYRRTEPAPRTLRHNVLPPDVQYRMLRAALGGFAVLVLTRWPVAAGAAGLLGWFSSDLLGGRSHREAGVARTEAIASWTEMLRDTIAAAHGLEAAITATAPVAPQAIRVEVMSLAIAIEREPLARALQRLAVDLAHPIADLVVAALTVAANGSVRELADLLGTLAAAARDEAGMQLRVEAARARMRTAVRVITGCTLATAAGLVVLNPSYVDVYSGAVGQIALALIAGCWGMALWWLAHMSEFRSPERFLVGDITTTGAER
ncbi:MAG: type II secretion system F family protein [Acidimicrobiia bacterium]